MTMNYTDESRSQGAAGIKINDKVLENVVGGTKNESYLMSFLLSRYGFARSEDLWDKDASTLNYDYMKKIFASRGYQFIPSKNHVDPDILGDRGRFSVSPCLPSPVSPKGKTPYREECKEYLL